MTMASFKLVLMNIKKISYNLSILKFLETLLRVNNFSLSEGFLGLELTKIMADLIEFQFFF